jgi:hypothetical protein
VVKGGDKSAKAKAGQLVEVQYHFPSRAKPENFEVKVNGKNLELEVYERLTTDDDKPIVGIRVILLQFMATGEGEQRLLISCKVEDIEDVQELQLEVSK